MDESQVYGAVALGFLFWIVLIHYIIRDAIKSATKSQTEAITTQNRLLIKLLEKQGVSKAELLALHEGSADDFWNTIKENA